MIHSKTKSAALVAALFFPALAQAHSFGRIYNLPVPLWLYLYGAAGALLLSFLVVGYFVTVSEAKTPQPQRDLSDSTLARWLRRSLPLLKTLSLLCLLLCMVTGLFGSRDPYRNFSMTFFWIVFMLGFAYFCALVGDLYALLNPWRLISRGVGRVWKSYERGRFAYPAALAYWPALAFYMAFIWLELFTHMRPLFLAKMLLAYSVISLAGVWLVGATAWFRYCDFLAVFLRLIALMAPLDYRPATDPGQRGRLLLRAPFAGLLQQRAEHVSLLLFVLFMLSSTAYDGLHTTVPWYKLFWGDATGLLRYWLGQSPIYAFVQLRPWYVAYETAWLLLSPFIYLGVYLLFVCLAKLLTRSEHSLRELALAFAFSLLPIALVYHITHYYTLILTQGVKITSLLSDPFGWGWNLFGTSGLFRAPILPEMGTVWHTQVALIVFGHIVSVYLAHVEALRLFPTRARAVLSQMPMLVLMMLFTVAGLWILVQPISPR
ncbi:hypothetical protein [Solimonas sp. SE-A11]|uniref:hypothetical protein n=1 Tax=Solimonas sp. SE-A11 TaxID=3054954 RepID=UPI00259CADCD|nr:hypothetical protein [Solimonas sp. SE-A11]MDM4772206.1 hypothetical protein [Solimonas sp. SE-A11]